MNNRRKIELNGRGPNRPIDELIDDYDMEPELAACFVGRNPGETERRIAMIKGYLESVVRAFRQKCEERVRA